MRGRDKPGEPKKESMKEAVQAVRIQEEDDRPRQLGIVIHFL